MSSAYIMPFVLPRQFTLDGRPLSGGMLYFYQSGTMTPKATYATPDKAVLNSNPVILDASGFAPVYLDFGAYRVIVQDSNGVQIEQPMDGITAGGSGSFGDTDTSVFAVGTYNQLRSLQTEYDLVYVAGRSFVADGGEGWFYHDPNSQLTDDDGYILTSNSGATKYIRLNQEVIDPRFYGVVYASASTQYTPFLKALNASVQFGLPVEVNGNVYINQNIVVPAKAFISVSENGFFTSTAGINMTFTATSNFKALGRAFNQTVQPIFEANTVQSILFSWIGATVIEDRWDKFLASSSTITLELNESVTLSNPNLSIPNKFVVSNGCVISVSSSTTTTSINIPNLVVNNSKMFDITTSTTLTSLNIGDYVKPELFGAVGNGVANDFYPVKYAIVSGQVYLQRGKSYKISGGLGSIGTVIITGGGTMTLDNTVSAYYLKLVNIVVLYTGSGNWLTGTTFIAHMSAFSNVYSVTNVSIDGCEYLESTRSPVYDGSPSLYNPHLPLIKNAPSLYTDSNGKIGARLWQEGKSWTVTNYVGNTQYYNSIKYLNNTWIIVGNNGLIKTSTDMINWTVRNSGTTVFLSDVAWNGTYYVVVGDSSTYLRSTDLITWTPQVTRPTTNGVPVFICTNGTRFVTTDRFNGQVVSSSDGLNWTSVYSFGGSSGGMASYGNGMFVCGGNNGNIAISYNGTSFVAKTCPSSPQFYTSFYDTLYSRWVMFSAGTVAISTDPNTNTWYTQATGQTETIYNALRVGNTIVAVGANGRIMTSDTGAYWTNRFSGTSAFMYGLGSNGYNVYASGASELIIKADL